MKKKLFIWLLLVKQGYYISVIIIKWKLDYSIDFKNNIYVLIKF